MKRSNNMHLLDGLPYTDKNGNLVTTPNGNAKVTSMVDVL